MVYSDYISSFTIVSPSGEEFDIRTIEGDDICIQELFQQMYYIIVLDDTLVID